jgi:hypothetical protein
MKRTRVAKLLGEDMELGNFVQSDSEASVLGSGDRAARAILREVVGIPSSGGTWSWQSSQVSQLNSGSSSCAALSSCAASTSFRFRLPGSFVQTAS